MVSLDPKDWTYLWGVTWDGSDSSWKDRLYATLGLYFAGGLIVFLFASITMLYPDEVLSLVVSLLSIAAGLIGSTIVFALIVLVGYNIYRILS